MRDDPLYFVNRMLAAVDAGDRDTFRQLTQQAADSEPAHALRRGAAAAVEHRQHLVALHALQEQRAQFAEQQAREAQPQQRGRAMSLD